MLTFSQIIVHASETNQYLQTTRGSDMVTKWLAVIKSSGNVWRDLENKFEMIIKQPPIISKYPTTSSIL